MDPAVAVPLHFTLEFLGVAAYAGLLGWGLLRRHVLFAAGGGALLVSQVIHTGQFVSGEAAGLELGLRLSGLILLVGGVLLESRRATPTTVSVPTVSVPTVSVPALVAPAVAATGGGLPELAWGTAALALVVAFGHAGLSDRKLWLGGWAAIAAGEAWLAIVGASPGILEGDVGLHLARGVGFFLVGAWAWRRTVSSLRLQIVAALMLVLFLVVVVAGGAVARVGAADRKDEALGRLAVEVREQQAALVRDNEDIVRRGGLVSDLFARTLREDGDPGALADSVLEEIFPDLTFVAVLDREREPIAGAGVDPEHGALLRDADAVGDALTGDVASGLVAGTDAFISLGAAPIWVEGEQTPETVDAAVVLGRRYGSAALDEIGERVQAEAAILSPGGELIAESEASFREASIPDAATDAATLWQGEVALTDGRLFAASAPLVSEDGSAVGYLMLARHDTALQGVILDASRALFTALLAAALLAVVVALWMSSRIVRPVMRLTETAQRVEEGDLEATSGLGRPDEIGSLAHAFDGMTGTLRSTIASERDARGRLETIVSGMGEGLVAMDEDYNIVTFNPAAERVTGVGASDAVGRKCYEVYGHATRGREGKPICDYICPLRHDGGTDGGVLMEGRNGGTLGLACSCSTLRDAEGNVVGGVDLLRDVTPELQAERMKSSFLANISHELRTPLTPVRGFAEILRRRKMPAAQAEGYLDDIIAGAERLERVVSILVDVAALEAGRLTVTPRPVSPQALVRDAVSRWAPKIPDRELRAQAPARLPEVAADGHLIGRVLDELIDNAVKFSPDGGRILVRARDVDSGGVEFSVSDQGIGIPPEALDALFEDFVQADPSETRQFGGLGVGLAFVRRVLEGHGSRLDVTSRSKRGSRFSFVLPRTGESRPKRAAKKRTTRAARVRS